jgi:hypothetical protein
MGNKMEFPETIIEQIQKLHFSTQKEAELLKLKTEEVLKTEIIWRNLKEFIEKGWILHILDLIEKETPRLKKMRSENHPAIPSLEELYHLVKKESEKIFRRYPALLENACREANLILDLNSSHPKYSLEQGFFRLEIDEKKRTARLSDYEGKLAEHPADIQAVVEILKKEHSRIFNRPFNGGQFLKKLRTQYKAIIKKENLTDGSSVPIRHITRRLGKNVKGFRTDEFLVDLSKLAEKGPFEIENRRLDLQQTKDTNQGMLLYKASTRGYIGFIVFKEV